MKVLALETATIEVGAAIVSQPSPKEPITVLASRRVRPGRLQAETLHPLIVEVVEASGTALDELDAIAVDVGPGLYTGLRVGITTAKALAFGLDLPIVAMTSTQILHGAVTSGRPVLAVIDMRRGEVVYARSEHPDAPVLCRPEECIALLIEDDSLKGAVLVGDGVVRHLELFRPIIAAKDLQIGDDAALAPDPAVLGQLAIAAMNDASYVACDDVVPLYLREADAKINWTTRDLSQVEVP